MKVALVQAPVWWTVDPPLGLAQVAGCVRHHGHEALVFDLNMLLWKERGKRYESLWVWEQFHFWNQPAFVARFFQDNEHLIGRFIEDILRTDAPVIGFSVCGGSQLATLELARRIKQGDPRRKIVLGGQYFFFGDKIEETMADGAIDAVVRGAADESFPALLEAFSRTGEVEPGPGVWVKREGRAVSGGEPQAVKELDRVPFADFSGFPLPLYTDPVRLPIAASRGCVWQCRFCSARAFWSGYTYMGGDRVFAEVMHHKRLYPERCHYEFYDITANGDVRALHRFASLMGDAILEPKNFIGWKINAIIRPEMTPEVLRDLRRANCHDIIYGIESGSPRVLKAMNKHYSVPVAEQVLKDTHEAGIVTTVNIMFGFPGETEEDFGLTLDFLSRNRPSLDRVYGSATFTSLEEKSYLADHQAEFGIKPQPLERFHNLYWESQDGTNTYPVRLGRFKRFRELMLSLGLDAYKGVNGTLEQDHLANLAQYHHHEGRPLTALKNHLDYLELDLYHEPTRAQLRRQAVFLAPLEAAARALAKAERPGAGEDPPRLTRLRERAMLLLRGLEGEDFRVEPEEGRQVLFWSRERVDPEEIASVRRRAELFLRLIEAEIQRGEDKRPEPVCAR